MLGKLIKNEFIQRGRELLLILGGVFLLSIFVALLWLMNDHLMTGSNYFNAFVILFTVAAVMVLYGSAIALLSLEVRDFGKRLFKDQGYLTHTLPVKTSAILFSRIVFDVVMLAAVMIVYPICVSIAARDFSIFSDTFNRVMYLLREAGSSLERAEVILSIVLTLIAAFVAGLACLWEFNAAYAIGHSFGKGKRAWTVVMYIVISVAAQVVIILLTMLMDDLLEEEGFRRWLTRMFSNELAIYNTLMLLVIILCFVGLVVMTAITNVMCKKRLNLE